MNINVLYTPNRRLFALEVNHTDGISTLVINVYMPCDRNDVNNVNNEYSEILDEICCLIDKTDATRLIMCGDWNTAFERNNAQTNCLRQFLSRNDLAVGWDHPVAQKGDTYINDSLGHRSCIDHFFVSQNIMPYITSMYVASDGINMSKHEYVILSLKSNFRSNTVTHRAPIHNDNVKRVAWHKCTEEDANLFKSYLDEALTQIHVPYDVLHCQDVFCSKNDHIKHIEDFCNNLIKCCISCSNEALPHSHARGKAIPFWNETAEPYRQKSLFWHWIWVDCGKPRDGNVARIMRATRSKYHLVIKQLKQYDNDLRKIRMGESIGGTCNHRRLWDEVKNMVPSGRVSATEVDGATDPSAIADVFANKFDMLYQSVPTDKDELDKLRADLQIKLARRIPFSSVI